MECKHGHASLLLLSVLLDNLLYPEVACMMTNELPKLNGRLYKITL